MTVEEIRRALRDAGLERLAEHVEQLVLPAIRIEAQPVDEGELPVGSSKIGGRPDLPPGFIWPEWRGKPLTFLAQLRLADLSSFDVEHLLPPFGVMWFFYEAETQPWGMEPSDRGAWRVAYYDGGAQFLSRITPPTSLSYGGALAAHRLAFSTAVTLPDFEVLAAMTSTALTKAETERYIATECEVNASCSQVLGHPNQIQGPMQLWCELSASGRRFAEVLDPSGHLTPDGALLERKAIDQWRLLLQLDSIQMTETTAQGHPWILEWGLGGMLYFWIRASDLKRGDFSRAWLQLQTS